MKPAQKNITVENGRWILSGDWSIHRLSRIEKQLQKIVSTPPTILDAQNLETLDTSGAWLLLKTMRNKEVAWENFSPEHQNILNIVRTAKIPEAARKQKTPAYVTLISNIGRNADHLFHETYDFIAFIGKVSSILVVALAKPKSLRFAAIARHVMESGIMAIPIVALIAFLISIVLAYQSITQLRLFGAEIFSVNLIAISVLREMGVLLTAIMVAGRSGSAFTAEIGVMQVNEEIDALQVMKLNPFHLLVLPRLIALLIALPLLTFIANGTGLLGGAVTICNLLDISWQQYITQLKTSAKIDHFLVGMIKAPFFAFVIACVGCRRGLQVTGSAESVGKLTTVAVVESIFLVLLIDALFSIFFSKIGM